MEQMYMIEIFVDKLTVFIKEGEESTANKNITVKVKFGPRTQFIVKEGQLAVVEKNNDDMIEVTESGRTQWSRTIRVGKSFLFPSYPDTVLTLLSKFPLEIEVWNDDQSEPDYKLYVGVGKMNWHTDFFHYLKETSNACKIHESLAIKEIVTLFQECCCGRAGEISIIVRLSALGSAITTEFQQLIDDPDRFCFRTDKAPSMFECKRIEGDDPNFCMVGSIYETTTLEDPDIVDNANKKIEICTELQSCGVAAAGQYLCQDHASQDGSKKKYTIDKIRMGDITGPCGNTNCPLAHKVKMYIRNLESYKVKTGSLPSKSNVTKKICGACGCKDDRWHRETCPEKHEQAICSGCGGKAAANDTCQAKVDKHFETGVTPKTTPNPTPKPTPGGSTTQVHYVKVRNDKDYIFKRDYIVENCYCTNVPSQDELNDETSTSRCTSNATSTRYATRYCGGCQKTSPGSDPKHAASKPSVQTSVSQKICVYNAEISRSEKNLKVYNVCTEIVEEKDCRCSPPKPSPPCNTFDCSCIPKLVNTALRKAHRPYCPLYSHKANCPVTMMHEEEGEKKEEEDDETEPLPYGLPPIRLGPCPVMGRPCSVPDGFARMYKTAVLPTQPQSYSDAGKVCCSKEYDRIRKAIKDYMRYQKDHDMRCVNRYNVDTEKRCCDKEQALLALMGRDCCGTHKLAIQEKHKQDKP